jgi:hypothetical protein
MSGEMPAVAPPVSGIKQEEEPLASLKKSTQNPSDVDTATPRAELYEDTMRAQIPPVKQASSDHLRIVTSPNDGTTTADEADTRATRRMPARENPKIVSEEVRAQTEQHKLSLAPTFDKLVEVTINLTSAVKELVVTVTSDIQAHRRQRFLVYLIQIMQVVLMLIMLYVVWSRS